MSDHYCDTFLLIFLLDSHQNIRLYIRNYCYAIIKRIVNNYKSMDPLAQLKKQTCPKHKDQPTTIASLAHNSPFPTLGCTICLDKQDKKIKHLYISLMRLLQIQKTYKQINSTDIQKQLYQITYAQTQINLLFEKTKFQIVKHSNDRKLAEKNKIDLPQYESLEQEYRTEVQEFNDKYLDIQGWLCQEYGPDRIDGAVRDKYFRENNAVKELKKIAESIQLCFDVRVKRNQSIDAQIKKFVQTDTFRLGEYSMQENGSMEQYDKKYKQHNTISQFQCYVPGADYSQWFDVTFLPRYLKQASIYASRIDFINVEEFSKQLAGYSGEVSEYKWGKLGQLSVCNKFNDKSLEIVFKMLLQNRPVKVLEFYQSRQTRKAQQQMMASSQQLLEIDIKKGINFTVFQSYQLAALQQLCIDRIELSDKLIQKISRACSNITSLFLIRNGLDNNAYTSLGEMLRSNTLGKLVNLTIAQNCLDGESEKRLFVAGQHLKKLQKLNLYGNKIDDSILCQLFKKDLTNLHQLILNKNFLKQPKAILDVQWKNLNILALDGNKIQTDFAIKLVNKKWVKPIRICLNWNKINARAFGVGGKHGNVKVEVEGQGKCGESLEERVIDEKVLFDQERKEIKFVLNNLEEVCKKYLVSPKQTFTRVDDLYDSKPSLTAILCESIVNSPPTPEQIQQSQQISQQLGKQSEGGNIEGLALLALEQIFRNGDKKQEVIFSKESSIQSQLGVKILSTQFLGELVKMEEIVNDGKWKYQQMEDNGEVLFQFRNWFIGKLVNEYKIEQSQFRIHKIEGMDDGKSIKVVWSNVYQQNKILQSIQKSKRVKIVPYFNVLRLSLKDFTDKINHTYGNQKKIEKIGGMQHYQPIKCQRYGINVSHMYGDDGWAYKKEQNEQWPIAYHAFISSCRVITNDEQAVMCCRIKNPRIEGGLSSNQQNAINVENTKMGQGYYCFPYINSILSNLKGTGVSLAGTPYHLFMQCRINPGKIRIASSNNEYWMMANPRDIRPYSVLLITKDEVKGYPSAEELYGARYTWGPKENVMVAEEDFNLDLFS